MNTNEVTAAAAPSRDGGALGSWMNRMHKLQHGVDVEELLKTDPKDERHRRKLLKQVERVEWEREQFLKSRSSAEYLHRIGFYEKRDRLKFRAMRRRHDLVVASVTAVVVTCAWSLELVTFHWPL